jgi:hypothetical protein
MTQVLDFIGFSQNRTVRKPGARWRFSIETVLFNHSRAREITEGEVSWDGW